MSIKKYFLGKNCLIDRELKDRQDLTDILGQGVLFLNQIHSKKVVILDKKEQIYGNQNLPKADAIVTNLKNIAIGVVTADCAPILMFDEENYVIAAVHSGWRGAILGIIQEAVKAMKKLGAKNIKAEIGPMIQQKSYEVSKDFLDEFLKEDLNNKKFFIAGVNEDKYLFDLPAYVKKKLVEVGVKEVENKNIDTYENEKDFFSFRRSTHQNQKDCGRNISVIYTEMLL